MASASASLPQGTGNYFRYFVQALKQFADRRASATVSRLENVNLSEQFATTNDIDIALLEGVDLSTPINLSEYAFKDSDSAGHCVILEIQSQLPTSRGVLLNRLGLPQHRDQTHWSEGNYGKVVDMWHRHPCYVNWLQNDFKEADLRGEDLKRAFESGIQQLNQAADYWEREGWCAVFQTAHALGADTLVQVRIMWYAGQSAHMRGMAEDYYDQYQLPPNITDPNWTLMASPTLINPAEDSPSMYFLGDDCLEEDVEKVAASALHNNPKESTNASTNMRDQDHKLAGGSAELDWTRTSPPEGYKHKKSLGTMVPIAAVARVVEGGLLDLASKTGGTQSSLPSQQYPDMVQHAASDNNEDGRKLTNATKRPVAATDQVLFPAAVEAVAFDDQPTMDAIPEEDEDQDMSIFEVMINNYVGKKS